MTSAQPPERRIRIGTAEREAAIKNLGEHLNAGRLSADEYGERVGAAAVAQHADELGPLFDDLPSRPTPVSLRKGPAAEPFHDHQGRAPLGGRTGASLVGASPFVALIAFFALDAAGVGLAWLAFLLVPIAGAVVYGDRRAESTRNRRSRRSAGRGRGRGRG